MKICGAFVFFLSVWAAAEQPFHRARADGQQAVATTQDRSVASVDADEKLERFEKLEPGLRGLPRIPASESAQGLPSEKSKPFSIKSFFWF